MKTNFIIILMLGLLFSQNIFADSPLTSTDFSKAYQDEEIVKLASKSNGELTIELMDYLADENNPIDLKVAVINELSWGADGRATLFNKYLEDKNISIDSEDARADILICFAYLKALDDYFNVDEAITYAQKAKAKNEKSYTINIICAIIEAQKAMESGGEGIFNFTNNVRLNKTLNNDMKEEAKKIIFGYMDLYQ